MYIKYKNLIYLFTYFILDGFWLASSEAIVLSLQNCNLPTVNKFHIK